MIDTKARKWANEAIPGHCKAGHAYLKKADVISASGSLAEDYICGTLTINRLKCNVHMVKNWKSIWCREDNEVDKVAMAMKGLREEDLL